MQKIWLVVLTLMLLSVNGYAQAAATGAKAFGGTVVGVASLSAVVEAIDYTTRQITLKNAQGEINTVVAGPEVINFAQINKGDKVNVDYSESVTILVSEKAMPPQKEESVEFSRAPLGDKPAGILTSTEQVVAVIENIDYLKRILTIKGPQRTVVVQINEEVPNFVELKIGDRVYLEDIKQLAISVTK